MQANVDIPLGIVIAPSGRQEVFAPFADFLAEKGFPCEKPVELPLLSDEGKAHRSYTDEQARRPR
jgi:hypothetical protein